MTKAVAVQNKSTVATKAATVEIPTLTKAVASKPLSEARQAEFQSAFVGALKGVADAEGSLMLNGGLFVSNLIDVSQTVRSGKATGPDDKRPAQGDYAKQILGISTGYMSRLLRVGRAVRRHDIRHGSKAFAVLVAKASGTEFAGTLGVSEAEYTANAKAIDKAFADQVAALLKGEDPKAVESKATREARPEGNDKGQTEGQAKAASDGLIGSPADLKIHLATVIFPSLKRMTDEQASSVVREMLAGIKADSDRREVLRQKAEEAKAKATKHGNDGKTAAPVKPSPATVAATVKAKAEPKA